MAVTAHFQVSSYCLLALQSRAVSQQTQNICITFIQRRPNVFDVVPTLHKCHTNVLSLLGCCVRGFAAADFALSPRDSIQIS